MKKILIVLWCNPKLWSWVEKVSYEIWKKLSTEFEVTFFFWSQEEIIEKDGNITYFWKKMRKSYIFDAFVFALYVNNFLKKNNFDLLIDNIWVNIFNNTKTIVIAHWTHINFFKKVKFDNLINGLKYYLFFWFMNWLIIRLWLRKSNNIITFCETIKNELIKTYGIDWKNITIINNWCDKNELNIWKKIFYDKLKILFISNDHIRKWIDILEQVAMKFENKNIEFNIIGKNYDSNKDNIKYLGKLSREDVYNKMIDSHILFLPSYYEWQPLVILEAMSFWCIPIVSKNCHIDFLYETELWKYISDKNDASFYIKRIEELNNNIIEIQRLSAISKNIVNEMTRENITDKYLNKIRSWL